MSQRQAFCVYSGKGVSDLRSFLTELFNTITEDMNQDDDTEYDDEYDGVMDIPLDGELAETPLNGNVPGTPPDGDVTETPTDDSVTETEMETGNEGDDDEEYDRSRTYVYHSHSRSNSNSAGFQHRSARGTINVPHHPELVVQRDRTVRAPSQAPTLVSQDQRSSNGRVNGQTTAGPGSSTRRTTVRVFGHQPVVETSTSPTPSDGASNRSGGTNQSSGNFFRTYQEAASSSRSNGALTPDLIFAEIGHGRGTNNTATGQHMNILAQSQVRRGLDSPPSFSAIAGPSSHSITQAIRTSGSQVDVRNGVGHDRAQVLTDSSNSYRRSSDALVAWPHVQSEAMSPSSSPTTRELHDSVQSALGISSQDGRETTEGRGRRVKRSLRNTISAAENYASSFLFGRGGSNGVAEFNSGWNNDRTDDGSQGR
jgi:F-box and leucine-rich repeat protein GRR1